MASPASSAPAAAATTPPPPFGILFTGSRVGFPILSSAFAQTGPAQWVLDLRSLLVASGVGVTPAAATAATAAEEELQRALGVKDVTLFLSAPGACPAGAGLALYVAVVSSPGEAPAWQYRGCVAEEKPSDAFPLAFPNSGGGGEGEGEGEGGGGGIGGSGFSSSSSSSTPPSLLPLSLVPTAVPPSSSSSSPALLVGVSLEPAAELAARESSSVASRLEFGRRVGLDLFRFAQSFAPATDPAAAAAGAATLPPGALDAWWRKFEAKFRRDPEFLLRRQE